MIYYKPIFSDEISKYEGKFVALIVKILEIFNERKYIKFLCIDPKGYVNVISYEPIDIEKFCTAIILGKVKFFDNQPFLYARKIIPLKDLNEEIHWRKIFLNLKIKEDKRKKIEDSCKKPLKILFEENKEIEIKKEILKFIRENDKGNGVSFEEVKNFFNISENILRKYIEELLSIGEIYEVSPDKYKTI